jgi:hypothetical protein
VVRGIPTDNLTSGNITIDVRAKAYADDDPPDSGDSIVGNQTPALSAGTDKRSTNVTEWTTAVASGTAFEFYGLR